MIPQSDKNATPLEHIGDLGTSEAQKHFEMECAQFSKVVEGFLLCWGARKQCPTPHHIVEMAATELYEKGRLNHLQIQFDDPESDRLTLELVVYHAEHNPSRKATIRAQIEKSAGIYGKSFDRAYQGFLERLPVITGQPLDVISGNWPTEKIREILTSLAEQNLPESEAKLQIAAIAQQSGWSDRNLGQIFADISTESEAKAASDDIKLEVEEILASQNSSVDLTEILPESLATPINKLAKWLNLRPEIFLMTLLGTASSLPKNGTQLMAVKELDFSVSPNLFVAIVAESSQRKSPVMRAIASKPLQKLHIEERDRHKAALEEWAIECKRIHSEDKSAELPPEPQQKVFYFTRTTGEAILRQAARQSEGMLYLADELKALFGSQNAYRSGRGSDEEDLLEYYDGSGGKVLRADGLRDDVDSLNLGIVGGIQPEVLDHLMGHKGDPNGKWSRFIFVHQPLAASAFNIDGPSIDLTDRLAGVYRRIAGRPVLEYRFTKAAKERFLAVCRAFDRLREQSFNQSLRTIYGKAAGRIAKLALNLHCLHWAAGSADMISEEIGLDMLEPAIKLANFAIQQIKALHSQLDEESIAPHLAKILEFSHRRGGWIKAREVSQNLKKMKTATIRQYFLDLEKAGMGEVKGTGKAIEFCSKAQPKNVGSFVGSFVGNTPTTENHTEQGFDKFVGDVGFVGTDLKTQQPQPETQQPQPETQQPETTYTDNEIYGIITELCLAPDPETLNLLSEAYIQGDKHLKQRIWAMMTPDQKNRVTAASRG